MKLLRSITNPLLTGPMSVKAFLIHFFSVLPSDSALEKIVSKNSAIQEVQ